MSTDEAHRRSRWILRALEWDDSRARYPNLWHEGMPCHILAFETVGSRLRLGDLIAIYHPTSQKHPRRSERFVGISRVSGLRRAHDRRHVWVDLETAFRFDPPFAAGEAPSRVFLCCEPGWPQRDVALFRKVFEAAVAAGFQPLPEETEEGAPDRRGRGTRGREEEREGAAEAELPSEAGGTPAEAIPEPVAPIPMFHPSPGLRLFGGVDYSGDMRDPKDATWFALLELRDERLRVVRLEATGRAGLEAQLRNSDAALMQTEAIGLDFPFGLPVPFAEALLGRPFPEEGWWALARRLERLTRPDYLVALQEFRDAHGEIKRLTDDRAGAFSPLHRVHPDLGPMTYHGIRMIAEERSRYAVRPFETARGRLLLEVYPGGTVRRLRLGAGSEGEDRPSEVLQGLARLERLPVEVEGTFLARCLSRRDALDAVVAARCTALAVLSGEVEKSPDELFPGEGDRVRREGWIYGTAE